MRAKVLFFLIPFCLLYARKETQAQAISLKFHPPVGTVYVSEFDIQTDIDQTIMGIEQNVNAKTFMVLKSTVLESHENFCLLEMVYQRLAIETKTAFFSMIIDSESDDGENPANSVLKKLTGQKFIAKINHKGELESIEGMEELFRTIMDDFQGDPEAAPEYKMLMEQSFGYDNLSQNFNQITPTFPEKMVKTGESWEYTSSINSSDFQLDLKTSARLESIENGLARIMVNSGLETPVNNEMMVQGINANFNMEGSQISEILIDISTGIPINSIINQEMEGLIEMNMEAAGTENMTVPMKIKSSIFMKTRIN